MPYIYVLWQQIHDNKSDRQTDNFI